jgi:hypothetical protein
VGFVVETAMASGRSRQPVRVSDRIRRLETALKEEQNQSIYRSGEHVRSCLLSVMGDGLGSMSFEPGRRAGIINGLNVLSVEEATGVSDLMRHIYRAAPASLWTSDGLLGVVQLQTSMAGLVEIGRRPRQWLRPLEWWRPDGSDRPLIRQLARYLFARWPVPEFLESAWMSPDCGAYQDWYVRIGAGGASWPAPLPYAMTRRQVHFLLQAPVEYVLPLGIVRAGVWADARAMGASDLEARWLAETNLGREHLLFLPEKRSFGLMMLRFLLEHRDIAHSDVNPLIDYLADVKLRGLANLSGLDLSGRSPEKLLREMHEHHANEARRREIQLSTPFPASHIEPWSEDDWEAVPVTTPRQLIEEGSLMRHCVANHTGRCQRGACSIWSLRRDVGREMKRMLTIEVANGAIIMARGFANRWPTMEERGVMERWAEARGLRLSAPGPAPSPAPLPPQPHLMLRIARQIVLKPPPRRLH